MGADVIDNASETEEILLRSAISSVPRKKAIEGSPVCLFCGEDITQDSDVPRRWCSVDCRNDWEKANR